MGARAPEWCVFHLLRRFLFCLAAGLYSEPRNPTLMRIFSFIGACDRAGSGLQMVFTTWNDLFGAYPVLSEGYRPFHIVFSLPIGDALSGRDANLEEARLTDERLMALLGESRGGLTAGDVRELAHVSLRVAQKRLKELYDAGKVVRVKEGQSFVYSLAN